uniref:Si:ch211-160o17.6 n=1 Tax=Macrostomum lignano TaxID=282301 RepID=A0A1I8FMG0_9PLAT
RDIKLRLEANAIELELQLKQQQLAAPPSRHRCRLSDLEAREHRFRCRGEKFQDELKITEEITRLVRMS